MVGAEDVPGVAPVPGPCNLVGSKRLNHEVEGPWKGSSFHLLVLKMTQPTRTHRRWRDAGSYVQIKSELLQKHLQLTSF